MCEGRASSSRVFPSSDREPAKCSRRVGSAAAVSAAVTHLPQHVKDQAPLCVGPKRLLVAGAAHAALGLDPRGGVWGCMCGYCVYVWVQGEGRVK